MTRRSIVFLINLLQDVNIVRPLAYMAAHEVGASVAFLLSHKFVERDGQGIWRAEIDKICRDTAATQAVYDSEIAAYELLAGRHGVLIAASESDLSAHAHTHNVFRAAPSSFLRVTLQHGFECVGFLQNREHVKAHGLNIKFAADLVCGWCDGSVLRSMAPSERPKLYVTGPSALVPVPAVQMKRLAKGEVGGLVCENLHSVRLNVSGDFKAPFMDTFFEFCARLGEEEKVVTLRPHPGGQYVLKNNVALPENVRIENRPMYDVDLSAFDFGISAPSSVVVDMVLAGIPAAVWRDGDGVMDTGNYAGLVTISGLDDWLAFRRDAALRPEMILHAQEAFLKNAKMPTEPRDVRERFGRLLANGAAVGAAKPPSIVTKPRERVLFFVNGFIPTYQLSFVKPLAPLVESGEIVTELITEVEMIEKFGPEFDELEVQRWLGGRIDEFSPTIMVFCRYSGHHTQFMLDHARARGAVCIFHIDDDLLNVPKEIGKKKFRAHNRPHRLSAVRNLLEGVDLVYCSTWPLVRKFREQKFDVPMTAGEIYCSGATLRSAVKRPMRKLGYMGFDHAHDLEQVLPVLVEFMRAHPHIEFELFGSIPMPEQMMEFGDRVRSIPPVPVYSEFLERFAELEWDIGICPLAGTDFNRVKANTKWVEYTSVGAAVVATRGMAYDGCCTDGCGELATTDDDWLHALNRLADDEVRFRCVVAAQARLEREYSTDRLRDQILRVFSQATALQSFGRTAERAAA